MIELDPDNPRRPWGTDEEDRQLLESIRQFGILRPILVMPIAAKRFLVIYGQRRFLFAKKLGHKTIMFALHQKVDRLTLLKIRWGLQATFKPLTKAEQAKESGKIRKLGFDPDTGRALGTRRKAA
jgi:hypothetical protein